MCKKLIVLVLSLCVISSVSAETVSWDFENGNNHRFSFWSASAAWPALDDPTIAGDEALTGAGGAVCLPDNGVAWTVGPPNQFEGQAPVVEEGCHVVNGVLEYGPCNDPFGVFDTDPPSYVNSRGQSGYLNTYNLSQWGDNLHAATNDQMATSPRVLLGEEATLTVWTQGGGSGTHAPEYDADETQVYTTGSSGIAVLSAEPNDLYALLASLHTQGQSTLTEYTLDLSAFAGKRVFVEVVDAFEGSWGWLAVDEIRITEKPRQAAMIVNDVNLPNGFDAAQKDRLESLNYEVTVVTGADVSDGVFTAADAEAFDVLVVSESIGSSQANNLIGANVPMMHQESYGWSRHFFTQGLAKAWLNDPNGMVDIVDGAHPIALMAGLAAGDVQFFANPAASWTTDSVESLVAGAVNVAQALNADGVANTIIFTIEAGTELADASLAANRVCCFSIPGNESYVAADMTDDAWALFDAAIGWLDPQLPSMVAHWPLNEGAGTLVADIVGGNDGTMVGLDPAVAWIADGELGGAVRFDGELDHHIEVPNSDVLDFGDEDFSISCWIRYPEGVDPIAANVMNGWVVKGTNAAPGTGNRYQLFIDNGGGVRFTIDNDSNGKSRVEVDRAPYMTGDWVQVVAVRDATNGELKLYADGILQGTAAEREGDMDISNGEPLRIGNCVGESAPMMGDIDDVRIFDRALSDQEIASIYSYRGNQ